MGQSILATSHQCTSHTQRCASTRASAPAALSALVVQHLIQSGLFAEEVHLTAPLAALLVVEHLIRQRGERDDEGRVHAGLYAQEILVCLAERRHQESVRA